MKKMESDILIMFLLPFISAKKIPFWFSNRRLKATQMLRIRVIRGASSSINANFTIKKCPRMAVEESKKAMVLIVRKYPNFNFPSEANVIGMKMK